MKRFISLVAVLGALVSPAYAAGDEAAGAKVFNKCKACHSAGENAKNRVGPVLNDIFGRVAGTYEGYNYSQAMIDMGTNGLVWTEETLHEYLPAPRAFVKGTKMTFSGLQNPQDIDNLIAYLLTFSPNYEPVTPPAQ